MPSITLGLFQLTLFMRLVRSEMLEVLRTDYIKFARARGLVDRSIYFGHALKNTLIPVITVTGLQLGSLIAFSIITEKVFQWPGLGLLFIQAVTFVDIPVIAAYLCLIGFVFVTINHRRPALLPRRSQAADRLTEERRALTDCEPLAAALRQSWDSDFVYSFRHSPYAIVAAVVFPLCVVIAVFAPWVAPHIRSTWALDLANSLIPPAWIAGGEAGFPLGTDDQGRDILSRSCSARDLAARGHLRRAVLDGARRRAGPAGRLRRRKTDAFIMRVADVQLSFPAILIALLIDGVARALLPGEHDSMAFYVLMLSIGVSGWVQYARTVRGSTLVEKSKEYVQAARLFGIHPLRSCAPCAANVLGPVLAIATIHIATAIITEATLSFLGVGVPPTRAIARHADPHRQRFPVLRRMVGDAVPGIALVIMVLAINLLGDWLRDVLNPRLRT